MEALTIALRAEGGTVAEHLATEAAPTEAAPSDSSDVATLAACGPRARGNEAEYELLVELILEGSRLHYGVPRVVVTDDEDLRLLLGDQLYALGLERLAALGDLAAVAELADVISLVAQAHAAGDPGLASAAWRAGAVGVGWGPNAQLDAAKRRARRGEPGATLALLEAARAGG